jgi:hypothetical protein
MRVTVGHWLVFGAFAKLRKATINFVMSIELFEWDNWAPAGRVFVKFDTGVCSENLLRILKFN